MSPVVSIAALLFLALGINSTKTGPEMVKVLGLGLIGCWFTYEPHAVPGIQSAPWAFAPALLACGLLGRRFITPSAKVVGISAIFVLTSLGVVQGYIDLQSATVASAGGFLKDVNLASAIVVACATVLWRYTKENTFGKVALILPTIGTLVISMSRSTIVAAIGALVIWAVIHKTKAANPSQRKVLVAATLIGWLWLPYLAGGLVPESSLGIALQSRLAILDSAKAYLTNSPFSQVLAGTGTGSWATTYESIRTAKDINSSGQYAHNDWVEAVVENGVSGLILFAMLLFFCVSKAVNGKEDSGESLAAVTLLLFSGFNFFLASALGCLLLGFLLGQAGQDIDNQTQRTPLNVLALCFILGPFFYYLPLQAFWAMQNQKSLARFEQEYRIKLMNSQAYYEPWQLAAVQRVERIGNVESGTPAPEKAGQEVALARRELNVALAIYPECRKCKILQAHLDAALGNRELAVKGATDLLEDAPYTRASLIAALRINQQYDFLNKEHKRDIALRCVQKSLSLEEATECAKSSQ